MWFWVDIWNSRWRRRKQNICRLACDPSRKCILVGWSNFVTCDMKVQTCVFCMICRKQIWMLSKICQVNIWSNNFFSTNKNGVFVVTQKRILVCFLHNWTKFCEHANILLKLAVPVLVPASVARRCARAQRQDICLRGEIGGGRPSGALSLGKKS
jgi:hypothetical protein